jgi:protein-disulfide isomerase
MSKKNSASARAERAAAALREQQRQEARRRMTMIGGVVGVLLVVVVAGFLYMRSTDSTADIAAPAAGSEYGVTIGETDAPHQVIVYEDFHCVHCSDLEKASNEELAGFAESGAATVEYRPIHFLTGYSERSANAFKVVLDAAGAEVAKKYHDLLYERYDDAAESEDGLDDDTLVDLAVDAGATEADVRPGIEGMTEQTWVDDATQAAQDAGVQGTPTVLLDGEPVTGGPEEIANSLADAIG